ncbi:MAG: nucleoside hydrolase [Thermoguttaceae bacterium]
MPKKIILDVDPGIDDAMAICMALFDPRLEVVAVTAVAGNVPAPHATRNVMAIIEHLDPPRLPRIGAATPPDDGLPVDSRHMYGVDALGSAGFEVAELLSQHPSEKILCDEIRAAPEAVTIVALGPLTNIARAFQRDPELASLVGGLVIMGGTVGGPGNITPSAEFNIYCDPQSAQAVFRSRSTKTLIPLDVTNRVVLGFDFLNQLPSEATRVGKLLHKIIPPAFRAFRQESGLEGIHVHDCVALMAVANSELFTMQEMAGDVEIKGSLTTGATVFDRRRVPAWRCNMDVAVDMDAPKVIEQLLRCLDAAGKSTA